MDTTSQRSHNRGMMAPRHPLTVVKLSDHFGQYVLILTCKCGHTRIAQPQTLARLAGWDAPPGGFAFSEPALV
jgi:hypothetical protein